MKQKNLIDSFKSSVWVYIDKEDQNRLLKRFFNMSLSEVNDIRYLLNNKLPCPFVLASMYIINKYIVHIIKKCHCDKDMVYKLSFEEFGCGVLLEDKPLGLITNTSVSKKDRLVIERLLKSSLNFNKEEKMLMVEASKEFTKQQLLNLKSILHDEMMYHYRKFLNFNSFELDNLKQQILNNKKEWELMSDSLEVIANGKQKINNIVDSDGDIIPVEITRRVMSKVKGQDSAIKDMSIHFYYQKKVSLFVQKNKKPPFRVDPVLVVGQTGHGKSFMIKTMCDINNLNYISVDVSSMVRTGIRGNSIDEMVKNIIRECDYDMQKAQSSVIILDEFDKLLNSEDTYNLTILNQFLRLIEGNKYPIEQNYQEDDSSKFKGIKFLDTSNIFFILIGSFQKYKDEKSTTTGFISSNNNISDDSYTSVLKRANLPKELEGRIKDIIVLNDLDVDAMLDILNGDSSPIKKYQSMLEYTQNTFTIDKDKLYSIAQEAIKHPYGARILDKLVYNEYKKYLYDVKLNSIPQNTKDRLQYKFDSKLRDRLKFRVK